MNKTSEQLRIENDQLLMQLGWLLERVLIKGGGLELPSQALTEADMIASMRELKRLAELSEVGDDV